MSYSFFDFIVDLMWGGSEVYLARKEDKKRKGGDDIADATAWPDGDRTGADRSTTREELIDRGKFPR